MSQVQLIKIITGAYKSLRFFENLNSFNLLIKGLIVLNNVDYHLSHPNLHRLCHPLRPSIKRSWLNFSSNLEGNCADGALSMVKQIKNDLPEANPISKFDYAKTLPSCPSPATVNWVNTKCKKNN
jgi:hypothetical protein